MKIGGGVVLTKQQLSLDILALIELEPRFEAVYENVGVPDLRRKDDGFEALMRAIVGQQLSVTAAQSIWQKLFDNGLTNEKAIAKAPDEVLRSHGLSYQKIRYIRSLIAADIDFMALRTMSDDEVLAVLTAVLGIGKWTAQMYLLFSLGRSDILALDDLAIKMALIDLLKLENPSTKELQFLSKQWAPYRTAASLLLWEHYRFLKNKNDFKVV